MDLPANSIRYLIENEGLNSPTYALFYLDKINTIYIGGNNETIL